MTAQIIDGKAIARRVRAEVQTRARAFESRAGRPARLDVVWVGDNPASQVYVRHKERAAAKAGLAGTVHHLPAHITQQNLQAQVAGWNEDPLVDGLLVQLPLPAGLDSVPILAALDPAKDVDGLHPINVGRLWAGQPGLRPCTPSGCMRLLREIGWQAAGQRALIVGRSPLVGKPLAAMLLQAHATVTVAHSRTADLAEEVARADLIVAAVGHPGLIQGTWLKPGAVVLDVGINRLPDGRLVGDVDYPSAAARAGHITPVPGGVGPMTIAMLLANTMQAAEQRHARSASM